MIEQKMKFVSAVNELRKLAEQRSSVFFDRICEFLVDEFQLYAAALFHIRTDGKLQLTGKSSAIKKTFSTETDFICHACPLMRTEGPPFVLHSDSVCELPSADVLFHEGCIRIKTESSHFLLKISQRSPFNAADFENYSMIARFLAILLEGSGVPLPGISFSKLYANHANDLRTSANGILGFASLLYDDRLNQAQAGYVTSLRVNAQYLISLINDLNDLARVDAGLIDNKTVEISPKKLTEEIIQTFANRFDANKVSFALSVDSGIPEKVRIDAASYHILLMNALLFMLHESEAGRIIVHLRHPQTNQLQLRLSNADLVIAPTSLKEFLHPSALSDQRDARTSAQMLISAVIAKKYAFRLNGDFDVTSAPGKGTVTSFSVELQSAPSIIDQISAALPKGGDLVNRVLVIEDDYATSKLLSNYLTKWGYEPTIVNSGRKALQILEQEKFLAIITDIVLPDINGLEMLKKIRENERTKFTPIIVCSVEAEQQKAFLMGAVEYFVKPIRYNDLVEVLTSYKLTKDAKVLCVDDDIPTLNLVKNAIESTGLTPIAESDSTKVMARIEGVELELAIVDLDMPGINGFELIKMIKSNPAFSQLPIIIYTGKEDFDADLQKINGLFTDLLDKRSTKIEDLADTVKRMFNRTEPIAPPAPAQGAPVDQTPQEKIPRILLVEDYKHSQIIVTRLLKKNNFPSVVVAENGAEAVEAAAKETFDLILMDMQMPVMNGFEATERVRQMPQYKDTPIIALTAFAMKGDREKCLDAGATDYIPKPIDSQEFIAKVKSYLLK